MKLSTYKKLEKALKNEWSLSTEKAKIHLNEAYCGAYEDKLAFTYEHINSTHNLSEYTVRYLDYEKIKRDIFIDDFFSIDVDNKSHIFHQVFFITHE